MFPVQDDMTKFMCCHNSLFFIGKEAVDHDINGLTAHKAVAFQFLKIRCFPDYNVHAVEKFKRVSGLKSFDQFSHFCINIIISQINHPKRLVISSSG